MAYVVNAAIIETWTFLDTSNAVVTGKADGDFTKTAYLTSNPASTTTVTIATVSGQSGDYGATFTPTAVGRWKLKVTCAHNGYTYRWEETLDVLTPAQADPAAALASTVSAVETIAGRITPERVARLDLITTGRITTRQPVAVDGTISLRPGESYLAADGRQIDVTSDGWPGLDGATIIFTITALGAAAATVSKTASTVAATAPDQTVRIELTTAETALLSRTGVYRYSIDAVISGDPYHLASDSVAVLG